MLSFFTRGEITFIGISALVLYQATSEFYVDGTKGKKRDSGQGFGYANFATHKFRYLNITPLMSASVKNIPECGRFCVDHTSCFSANLAAFFHEEGRIMCELLPGDKYNKSDKFLKSAVSHHLAIKVSKNKCN